MTKINKTALRKLERDTEKTVKKVSDRANRAAAKQSTPKRQVRAYANELRKAGIEVDEKALRKQLGH